MFKDYKYSVISITHITSFFRFLLLSTSNVRMSEGTFCRVEVHISKVSGERLQDHWSSGFKCTKMKDKRILSPDKSSSADVSRVLRSHDQDGHHTHIW